MADRRIAFESALLRGLAVLFLKFAFRKFIAKKTSAVVSIDRDFFVQILWCLDASSMLNQELCTSESLSFLRRAVFVSESYPPAKYSSRKEPALKLFETGKNRKLRLQILEAQRSTEKV